MIAFPVTRKSVPLLLCLLYLELLLTLQWLYRTSLSWKLLPSHKQPTTNIFFCFTIFLSFYCPVVLSCVPCSLSIQCCLWPLLAFLWKYFLSITRGGPNFGRSYTNVPGSVVLFASIGGPPEWVPDQIQGIFVLLMFWNVPKFPPQKSRMSQNLFCPLEKGQCLLLCLWFNLSTLMSWNAPHRSQQVLKWSQNW